MEDLNHKVEFAQIFESLRDILCAYEKDLILVTNDIEHYYLNTAFIMKNKKPMYFGSVKINKSYVSYHLMPVYVFPDLLAPISAQLGSRMQGKSCFNFKRLDSMIFEELSALTRKGYLKYQQAGYV